MRRNVLEVKDLVRNYRKSVIKESEEDVKVLKGISFQVAEGEFVGIMGKSGCGKTTFFMIYLDGCILVNLIRIKRNLNLPIF